MTGRLRALYVGCALMGIVSLFGIVGAVIHGGGGGVTGWPTTLTTAATTSESTPIKIRGSGALSDDGWNLYTHSNGTPTIVCVVNDVERDCDVKVVLEDDKKYQIIGDEGQVLFEVDETTGAITNVTIDAEATGNTLKAPFKHNFKMVGCSGATGTLLLDTNATLAPTPTCTAGSTNTTLIMGHADFPDSAGEYQVQDSFQLPADFSASDNIDIDFYWRTSATSGDVIWYVRTFCTANAEVEDAAWNTASSVTDTALGTTLQLNLASITNVTKTGCAAREYFHIKIYRDNSGSDTLAATAQLRNAELTIRRAM